MEGLFNYILYPAIGSLLTILTAYATGFRLQKSQVKQTDTQTTGLEYDNYEKYVRLNNVIIQDLKVQVQELIEARRIEREDNKKLQERVAALTKSNNNLCREVAQLKDSFCNDCPKKISK